MASYEEPIVAATITVPEEYLGKTIELCEASRGSQVALEFFTKTQVILKYTLPLANLVDDFFGRLKSLTKGYASLDYEDAGFAPADVVKLQLLVNKLPVDALAQVMHRSQTPRVGRAWVERFKTFVERQLFEVVIQAAVGKRIVARETIKPVRKDVTAKLYGGDPTRRMKLLEKQKAGRKKLEMRSVGMVRVKSEAFQGFLRKEGT